MQTPPEMLINIFSAVHFHVSVTMFAAVSNMLFSKRVDRGIHFPRIYTVASYGQVQRKIPLQSSQMYLHMTPDIESLYMRLSLHRVRK